MIINSSCRIIFERGKQVLLSIIHNYTHFLLQLGLLTTTIKGNGTFFWANISYFSYCWICSCIFFLLLSNAKNRSILTRDIDFRFGFGIMLKYVLLCILPPSCLRISKNRVALPAIWDFALLSVVLVQRYMGKKYALASTKLLFSLFSDRSRNKRLSHSSFRVSGNILSWLYTKARFCMQW